MMSYVDEARLPIDGFEVPETPILTETTDSLAISYLLPATETCLDFDPTINDSTLERTYRAYVAMEGERQLAKYFPIDAPFVDILDHPEVREFICYEDKRRRDCIQGWAALMGVDQKVNFEKVDHIEQAVVAAQEEEQLPRDGARALVGTVYDALSHYYASRLYFERAAFAVMLTPASEQ
jgi:hypothetical protein